MPNLRHLEITEDTMDLNSIPTHLVVLHLIDCRVERGASVGPLSLDRLQRLVVANTGIEESFSTCFRVLSLEEFILYRPYVFTDNDSCFEKPVNPFSETFFGPLPSLKRLWVNDLTSNLTQAQFFPSSLLALRMTRWKTSIGVQDESPQIEEPLLPHLEELTLQDCDFSSEDFIDLLQDSRQKSGVTTPGNIRVCQGDPPAGWSRYPFQSCPPFYG
jgi:hypothetical protein